MDAARQIEYYEAKLKLDPRSRVFAPLADLYRREGRYDDALRILDEGLGRHPDYLTARVIKGRCHFDRGDFDTARGLLENVLEADPDNLVVLRLLTEDAARRRDWDEALRLSGLIVRLDPHDGEAETRLKRWRSEQDPREPDEDALSGRLAIDADAAVMDTESPAEAPAVRDKEPAASVGEPAAKDESLLVESHAVDVDDGAQPTADEEADPAAAAMGEQRQAMATRTLADVYLAQGYREKALQVLRRILENDPGREDVRERIAALEADDAGDAQPADEAAAPEADLDPAVAPVKVEGDEELAYFETWLTRLKKKKEEGK